MRGVARVARGNKRQTQSTDGCCEDTASARNARNPGNRDPSLESPRRESRCPCGETPSRHEFFLYYACGLHFPCSTREVCTRRGRYTRHTTQRERASERHARRFYRSFRVSASHAPSLSQGRKKERSIFSTLMPSSRRKSSIRCASSSEKMSETARPRRPSRAVRPATCTYESTYVHGRVGFSRPGADAQLRDESTRCGSPSKKTQSRPAAGARADTCGAGPRLGRRGRGCSAFKVDSAHRVLASDEEWQLCLPAARLAAVRVREELPLLHHALGRRLACRGGAS